MLSIYRKIRKNQYQTVDNIPDDIISLPEVDISDMTEKEIEETIRAITLPDPYKYIIEHILHEFKNKNQTILILTLSGHESVKLRLSYKRTECYAILSLEEFKQVHDDHNTIEWIVLLPLILLSSIISIYMGRIEIFVVLIMLLHLLAELYISL